VYRASTEPRNVESGHRGQRYSQLMQARRVVIKLLSFNSSSLSFNPSRSAVLFSIIVS
jgi:hypothetical protein